MQTFLTYLTPLVVAVLFGVLIAGLVNMMRGTSPSASQRLMRWRVGLQFVVVCVVMALLLLRRT